MEHLVKALRERGKAITANNLVIESLFHPGGTITDTQAKEYLNNNLMKPLQQGKINTILSKKFNYQEGIMTRREWIELMHRTGATVKEGTKSANVWNRRKFNRMDWKEQQEYQKKLDEKLPCYELYRAGEGSIYTEITKTEYDYFNSL